MSASPKPPAQGLIYYLQSLLRLVELQWIFDYAGQSISRSIHVNPTGRSKTLSLTNNPVWRGCWGTQPFPDGGLGATLNAFMSLEINQLLNQSEDNHYKFLAAIEPHCLSASTAKDTIDH
ncbi:MAG: hypothetical protein MUF72_03560 [Elainella sp. Prado103]|jgi:hypothetical protein|nr:hypothetical protein [Elainella sp. Prado103]